MYNRAKKEVTVMARTAKTVTVHLKMDEDVKNRMERVCAELGISMSEAFNMFARTLVRERRIPFEVAAEPFYKEINLQYLEGILADVREGKAHFAEHDLIEVD